MNGLRIAVIGAGHLGRIHAKLLAQVDGAELVAISDPVAEARANAKKQFSVPIFADYRDLIDKVDAAIIAAPTDFHASIATDFLNAGKHLMVEKPLATFGGDARRLATLASARRLTLQVGHVERFNPAFTALAGLATDVKYVEAVRASRFPGRCLDVGVVLDLMIHDIDLVLSFTDANIRSVSASGLSVISRHEDIAETRIEFEDGLVANLKASRISPTPARQMQVYGARGFAELDFSKPALSVVQASDAVIDRTFALEEATTDPLAYANVLFSSHLQCGVQELQPRNAILDELHDFVISIQSGISPAVNGQAGARAVETADAVLAAIAKRCWYHDVKATEVGPHAQPRERIDSASRRIHEKRRAA